MTTTRSAPSAIAGASGALRRTPPSPYQPAASRGRRISTAGNAPGIAADASTCSGASEVAA